MAENIDIGEACNICIEYMKKRAEEVRSLTDFAGEVASLKAVFGEGYRTHKDFQIYLGRLADEALILAARTNFRSRTIPGGLAAA